MDERVDGLETRMHRGSLFVSRVRGTMGILLPLLRSSGTSFEEEYDNRGRKEMVSNLFPRLAV